MNKMKLKITKEQTKLLKETNAIVINNGSLLILNGGENKFSVFSFVGCTPNIEIECEE